MQLHWCLVPLPARWLRRAAAALVVLAALGPAATRAASLALCAKCASPTIFSLTGADTTNAVAKARLTREEIEGWCANWSPGDKDCARQKLASEDLARVYSASADCSAGRITAVDGNHYTLAGTWDHSDIGGGRSRWRDAQGRVVGRDNASGGLGISQQWEVLCPSAGKKTPAKTGTAGAGSVPGKASPQGAGPPLAEFAVGQTVMAKYAGQWVRARIDRVRQVKGRHGPELVYDVSLDNGKRGIVPPHMLRVP